jgi:2-polyprenyl-3-methyl-5-hydroxy-6-metoxy-1,4-benzoquinol methylase
MNLKLKFSENYYLIDNNLGYHLQPLFIRQLVPYLWVSGMIKNKTVVDIGCWHGYGAYILSLNCKQALGIDKNRAAINKAAELYKNDNLKFVCADVKDLHKIDISLPEVVTAMQFIEHLVKPDDFFNNIKKLLSEKSVMILSTPNKRIRERSSLNINHATEYDVQSLTPVLKNSFNYHKLFFLSASDRAFRWESERVSQKGVVFPFLKSYIPKTLKKKLKQNFLSGNPKNYSQIGFNDFWISDQESDNILDIISVCSNKELDQYNDLGFPSGNAVIELPSNP